MASPRRRSSYNIAIVYRDTGNPSKADLVAWPYPEEIIVKACVANISDKQCGDVNMQPRVFEGAVPAAH